MKLLALERTDSNGINQIFIGNFIYEFEKNFIKQSNNQGFTISWEKKTKEYNINSNFKCNSKSIKILNNIMGYFITFTIIHKQTHSSIMDLVNDSFIPTIETDKILKFDFDRQSYSIKRSDISKDKIKERVMEILHKYSNNSSEGSKVYSNEEEEDEENRDSKESDDS